MGFPSFSENDDFIFLSFSPDLNVVIILSSDFTINFFFYSFDDILLFLLWLRDVEIHNFFHWSIPTGGMNRYFVLLFSFSCCFSLSLLFVIIFIIIWFSYFREVIRILRFWIKKIHTRKRSQCSSSSCIKISIVQETKADISLQTICYNFFIIEISFAWL